MRPGRGQRREGTNMPNPLDDVGPSRQPAPAQEVERTEKTDDLCREKPRFADR